MFDGERAATVFQFPFNRPVHLRNLNHFRHTSLAALIRYVFYAGV
jgi:hypothetical protein